MNAASPRARQPRVIHRHMKGATMSPMIRVVLATVLSLVSFGPAMASEEVSPIAALSRLHGGDWVQLEGIVQKDASLVCTKMKLVASDVDKMDWSLRGPIRNLDPVKSEFSIGRYRVKAAGNA